MNTLIFGLSLFFAIHLLPAVPKVRNGLISKVGEGPYKGVFALISLSGFVLIVIGMADREYVPIWQPPVWTTQLALVVTLPVFTLLAAAYLPGNVKRFTRHPMLWGVTLFAGAHLTASGDLGAMVLFGSFLGYSLFAMWSGNNRGAEKSLVRRPYFYDIALIILGLGLYLLFLHLHPQIAGVPVTG